MTPQLSQRLREETTKGFVEHQFFNAVLYTRLRISSQQSRSEKVQVAPAKT
jgi:hypothetical protein